MTEAILEDPAYDTALAIIGMSGRFPGASDTQTLWQNIAEGVISIQQFSDEELLAAGCDPSLIQHSRYVKAGTVLPDLAYFDASFFGFSPTEAEYMDPQHRLFLQCAWEALEDAGYIPGQTNGLVGIFAGSRPFSYFMHNLFMHKDNREIIDRMMNALGNDCDAIASMVAYKLNLKGPSMVVQTACSTSLVATHLACQSLLTYECDIALAGGVALAYPQPGGYLYDEKGILSPDGSCRTFDENSRGGVIGNGLGLVVLKRLKEALEDGDMIYAMIRGSAVNNDGGTRAGYTAPGLEGQRTVIAEALNQSGLPYESITYIEAHGIGTQLGDAIELAALTRAFVPQTRQRQFCALGSIKPNIGHLDRAAGITGLIKTALALHHKQLPPSMNFERTSNGVDLTSTPFYVNTRLQAWGTDGATPRRAGVNSFGVGGTNAHVVLEEAPVRVSGGEDEGSWKLLPLAARSEQALQQMAHRLADHLTTHPELSLADAAYTLQVGRTPFLWRRMVVCQNMAEAIKCLRTDDSHYAQPGGEYLLPEVGVEEEASKELLETLGLLWLQGAEVDWPRFTGSQRRFRVPLPTYPFELERFWIELDRVQQVAVGQYIPPEASPVETSMVEVPYVAPQTLLEQRVVAIWSELLNIDRIGIDDNFFHLGGHSLLGTQVVASLRDAFQVDLPLIAIFETPTVAALAAEIEWLLLDEVEQMVALPSGVVSSPG